MAGVTLLIVDDEQIERQNLVQFVRENLPQVERIETAENGLELMVKAQECSPDILLVDIEMPGMTGLDGLNLLRKKGLVFRTIIYSAHNQFNYAQEAILLDVDAYLLKPARRADLLRTLSEVVERVIDDSKAPRGLRIADNLYSQISPLVQSEFIRAVILDDLDSENMAICLSLLSVPFTNGCILTLAFDNVSLPGDKIRSLIQRNETLVGQCVVGPVFHGQCTVYYLLDGQLSDEQLLERCGSWSAAVIGLFDQIFGAKVRVGIGTPCRNLSDLTASYRHSQAMLHSADRTGPLSPDPFLRDRVLLERLLTKNDARKLVDHVNRIFGEWGGQVVTPVRCRQWSLDFLLRSWQTVRLLAGNDQTLEEILGTPLEILETKHTLAAIREWLVEALERMCSQWKSAPKDTGGGYIRAAMQYIQTNFSRPFSLEEVADYVGISSYYLCTLFKKELNKTFLQYLTDYRLGQADLLLRETGLPLEKIAERVGYQNGAYFKRVFNRHREHPKNA